MTPDIEEIHNFWFCEIGPNRWFALDAATEASMREKFLNVHEKAAREELQT